MRDAQIEDIARAVGINRAIIYRHFSGKEELFALTLVGYLEELAARLAGRRRPRRARPRSGCAALTAAFVDYGLEYPAFVDCALTLMRRPGPELLDEISEGAMFRLGRGIATCLATLAARHRGRRRRRRLPHRRRRTCWPTRSTPAASAASSSPGSGMLVKEAAPGVPAIARLSAEQVKEH